jgi:hypothetical protein
MGNYIYSGIVNTIKLFLILVALFFIGRLIIKSFKIKATDKDLARVIFLLLMLYYLTTFLWGLNFF